MTSTSSPAVVVPRQYHPAFVTLHWLIAILVFITPLLAESEGRRGGALVGGIPTIGVHMILGLIVLGLLAVRLLLRFALRRPQWATAGNPFFDLVGRWTHVGLYLFTFAVATTGLIFALQTNRLAAVFGQATPGQSGPAVRQPGQIPPPGIQPGGEGEGGAGFAGGVRAVGAFLVRAFHELSWKILLALIILHVAAALYHQFILKDNLLKRMWFGSGT